jgi:2-polyprenyl-3-methyl-5-hydroxy-6-metoxy-1,4-benzoquinol methylase
LNNDASTPMKMFSKDWYNEYFKRAISSAAHSEFCERVYGKDLCQHGLMDMDELEFLTTLIEPGSKVLEIGCSNGFITEYIHDHTRSEIMGVDFSEVAIEQAQERTKNKSSSLSFKCINFKNETLPGDHFDIILLFDSIYFLGEVKVSLLKLNQKLREHGRMILSIFQYREEADPQKILLPERTFLAEALNELRFTYTWTDFTDNVRAHGKNNFRVAEELKEAFLREGNLFLYEARSAENMFFREASERGTITRFMYIVEKNPLSP